MRQLFRSYFPRLLYFADDLIDNRQEAEDIAITALAKAWETLQGNDPKQIRHISSWLFTAVRNACFNYLKHQRVVLGSHAHYLQQEAISEEDIEAHLIGEDIVNKIYLEIQQLPPRCRKIAELSYIRGLSSKEIGEELDIASSTVRSQQARAMDLLREALVVNRIFPEMAVIYFISFFLDRYPL